MDSEDREITLGLGRMLGLFFVLVAICGVFLSIGYSLGKSTAREQALNDEPSQVLAAAPPSASESAGKPSAAIASKADAVQPAQEQATAPNLQNNLTFYKAVQQNGASMPAPAKESISAAPVPTETVAAVSAPNAPPVKETAKQGATPVSSTTPVTGPGTIVVQIAAITREDDAVALAGALRKKDYNVIVVKNPAINDKFYHVQVGPFTTLKDADAMKARLVAEGYNPILKK
jgi:cell division septation protein DedD